MSDGIVTPWPVDYDEPRRQAGRLAWRGLQWLAPNLTDPSLYAPLPPPPPMPEIPQKIQPSDHDPRFHRAAYDVANILMMLAPVGPGGGLRGIVSRALPASPFRAGQRMASGSSLHPPPQRPLRPFEADYPPERWPDGVPSGPTGGLLKDIEGRPLHAVHVAGRRTAGGEDVHIGMTDIDDILSRLNVNVEVVASDHPWLGRKNNARFVPKQRGLSKDTVFVNWGLPPIEQYRAKAHELGHVIQKIAGPIRLTEDMTRELKPLYSALATGRESAIPGEWTLPRLPYYWPWERNEELVSEAIRAIAESPNYVKTAAPRTADVLRATMNDHPVLSPVFQVNSLAALGAGGTAAALFPIPEERAPFFLARDD